MPQQPWDDPSLANEETKKLREKTKKLRMNPLKPSTPKEAPGITGLKDAFGAAEAYEKRQKKWEKATRPIKKILPKDQGE